MSVVKSHIVAVHLPVLRPDGEFELMSYRLNTHVKPLIWVEAVLSALGGLGEVIKLRWKVNSVACCTFLTWLCCRSVPELRGTCVSGCRRSRSLAVADRVS